MCHGRAVGSELSGTPITRSRLLPKRCNWDNPDEQQGTTMIKSRTRKRDGRKVYDVRLRDPSGNTYGRTFPTLAAAKDFEATERADQARGVWVDLRRGKTPFRDAAAKWSEASAHKRPLSVERDRAIIEHHLNPVLGDRALVSIRPGDIQQLVNAWVAKSPPATVSRQYATLRAIFNHAVTTDSLGRSPCRGVRLPQVEPRESPLVTAKDLEKLALAMPEGLEPVPYLGAVLGLSWAEIAGLRVASLNFLSSTVTVDRQWTRGTGGVMVSQNPKSRAGRRTLAVPDWLMVMLTDHLAARGLTGADREATVLVGHDGQRLDYSNWRQRVWLPAIKRTGLTGLRFHDLRHTAGTALVAGGVDIKTAQVRLGHASPLTTLRVYAQATQDADRAAAKSLGQLFRPGQSDKAVDQSGEDVVDGHDSVRHGRDVVVETTSEEDPGEPLTRTFAVEVLHRYSNIRYLITSLVRAHKAAGKPRKPGRSSPSPVPIRRRLSQTLHPEIIAMYEAGATTRQLAKDHGVSKGNIEHLLHQAGVRMRNQPLTPEQIREAAHLHAQGLSTYKIAERFGVVQSTVWRALRSRSAPD
jgi:integrase